jgi:hypothetical protein
MPSSLPMGELNKQNGEKNFLIEALGHLLKYEIDNDSNKTFLVLLNINPSHHQHPRDSFFVAIQYVILTFEFERSY